MSYDFNRAALAKQRLMNLRLSGRKVRGSSVANLMRSAGLQEEELDENELDQIEEVLSKDASASDWISDFVKSDAPQFSGKSKKERIKMALGAYYGKQNKKDQISESETAEKQDMAETQLHFIKYAADEIIEYIKSGGEVEEWYQNKLSKVFSEMESLHSHMEGTKRKDGMVQESEQLNLDEEGNMEHVKKSFKEFMEGMTATQVRPGVTRYTGGSYGNAKGAKYGNTDYDHENLEKNDDEGSSAEPQKRGRGRPAGAKSGARGPRIK